MTNSPLSLRFEVADQDDLLSRFGANLRAGGIFLPNAAPPAPGTEVHLVFAARSGYRAVLLGRVASVVAGRGMNVAFERWLAAAEQRVAAQVQAPRPVAPAAPAAPAAAQAAPARPAVVPAQAPRPAPVAPQARAAPAAQPVQARPPPSRPTRLPRPDRWGKHPIVHLLDEPDEPAAVGPVVGIDLGTTNSCVAIVQGARARVLRDASGRNTVPSVVSIRDDGRALVGHEAKKQITLNPHRTIYGSKRFLGRAFHTAEVEELKKHFNYQVTEGPGGEVAVLIEEHIYLIEEISALVLAELKRIASEVLRTPVQRAVISVPAYYNDNQRQAVRRAGRLAGLRVERIVNEPTAAALSYGFGRTLERKFMVYDFGGGTFDVSVLEVTGDVFEVLATGGEPFLGGVDMDDRLVQHILGWFRDKYRLDVSGEKIPMERIRAAAEAAKCILSEQTETEIHLPYLCQDPNGKQVDLRMAMKRDEVVRLTSDLVERTMKVAQEVSASKNGAASFHDIILVGGQSRSPLVQQRLREIFGKEPLKNVHPDEAVAAGAALLAESHDRIDSVTLIDVLPHSIGIGRSGGLFERLWERNTALPAERAVPIATTREGQRELDILMFQGESDRALLNEYIGTLTLRDIPPGPKGAMRYELRFRISPEGLVKVVARDTNTGYEQDLEVSMLSTPESIRDALEVPMDHTEVRAIATQWKVRQTEKRRGWFARLLGRYA